MHVFISRNSDLIRRYGISTATVFLAIAVVRLLQPLFGGNVPPLLLMPFVLVAAWFGGLSSGLLSTGLQSLAAAYLLIPPNHSWGVGGIRGWITVAIFFGQGVLISWLCESRRRMHKSFVQASCELRLARTNASAQLDSLEHFHSELKALTSAIVRDLPVPMDTLRSLSDRLASISAESIGSDVRDCISGIQTNASRIADFVSSLKRYSTLNEGERLLTSIDSRVLVEGAVARCANKIRETGTSVTYDRQLPVIRGDAWQLLCVFEELIENAIKFRGDEPPRLHISCKFRNSSFVFSVSDNGIGIIPARWEEAFVPFRRLNSDQHTGSGVGLAICRRIVESHGGRIWLSSAVGVGTSVRFRIPLEMTFGAATSLQTGALTK